MPNRVLSESVKRSEQIDQLSWFDEVVFYRALLTADDYGCLDGRPKLLKSDLFPTRDDVTRKAIEDSLAKLTSTDLLRSYEVSGKPYMLFPTWEKHQRIRRKKQKYPWPCGRENDVCPYGITECRKTAATCCQSAADCRQVADKCRTSAVNCPPESESESESESIRESKGRKRAAFTPPTLEEITEFCTANAISIDAERFFDYYSSNGWMVGKNKMRDWQAAVRSWSKRDQSFGKPKKEKPERHVSFDIEEFESRMFKILD